VYVLIVFGEPLRAARWDTNAQWVLIESLLSPIKTGGRPEKHPRRAIVDAICTWSGRAARGVSSRPRQRAIDPR
jgi:hypothetical protein